MGFCAAGKCNMSTGRGSWPACGGTWLKSISGLDEGGVQTTDDISIAYDQKVALNKNLSLFWIPGPMDGTWTGFVCPSFSPGCWEVLMVAWKVLASLMVESVSFGHGTRFCLDVRRLQSRPAL